jgi:hypothetical protein
MLSRSTYISPTKLCQNLTLQSANIYAQLLHCTIYAVRQ